MIPRTLEPEVMDTAEEAVDYDRMDHSQVNRQFVDDLLAFAEACGSRVDLHGPLADLGTGTALILQELASRKVINGPMLAIDLSLEMLKLAMRHLHSRQLTKSVLPVYSDARTLPLSDQSCAFVVSNSIVHHIAEPIAVLREIRRVIRPGGIIFVRDLMRPQTAAEVERFVQTYAAEENTHQQQMFRQSLHAALTVEEVRELLRECGFSADLVSATSDRHWTIALQA